MINFPILRRLDVQRFGLFPGSVGSDGLCVSFKPGLTIVLGSNGLGKTTLVTILFRTLTGPFDIPCLLTSTGAEAADLIFQVFAETSSLRTH